MYKCFFGIVLFYSSVLFAQQIKVIDAHTLKPLHNVKVVQSQPDQIYYTNTAGFVVIKKSNKESLYEISQSKYATQKISQKNLRSKIKLVPRYESLESLVMSVVRTAENKKIVPEQIEVVTKKKRAYVAPQTSADLLNHVNGVRVQKSQLGGGSPVIRGLEANRVLLVVDGVRLNNAIYRSGHLQNAITISPLALERTEVVFGPTSVTYGSDALGGVVHYYTKSLYFNKDKMFKNHFLYRHSTVNNEHTAGYSLFANHNRWASYTNISYSRFGDLKMGKNRAHGFNDWGKVFRYSMNTETEFYLDPSENSNPEVQKNTAYQQLDVLQKWMFPVHKSINLLLNMQFSTTSDVPNFGKLNDENPDGRLTFAEWNYGPQQRLLLSSQLKFNDHPFSIVQNGALTFAYQNILESRVNRRFGSFDRVSRNESVDVWSLNGDFYKNMSKKGGRKLYYGLEMVHNQVASRSKGETLQVVGNHVVGIQDVFEVDTRYPNQGSSYSSAAIYSSFRQKLDHRQVLNAGLRYTYTWLKANWEQGVQIPISNNQIVINNQALTGSLGYTNHIGKSNKLSLLLSKGFRSPNVDDIGKIRVKSGRITVPNTQLKPEHLYSAEFGYQTTRGKWGVDFRTYYTLFRNYISRNPSVEFGTLLRYDGEDFEDDEILANTNIGNAYIYGGTLSSDYQWNSYLKSSGSVTFTKGALFSQDQPLSSIPPVFGQTSISYVHHKFDVALEYRFSLAKDLEDYNLIEGIDNLEETPNEQGTPAWHIFSINSNYRMRKGLRLQLQLQNILDRHYKEFASSISAPGRNIAASVAYSF